MKNMDKFYKISILFLVLCLILTTTILFLNAKRDLNSVDKIPRQYLSEDYLASKYVKQHYPEFENCTIKYDNDLESDCSSCPVVRGVNIYCSSENLGSSGDLSEYIPSNEPSFELEFINGLTINDLKRQEKEEWKKESY